MPWLQRFLLGTIATVAVPVNGWLSSVHESAWRNSRPSTSPSSSALFESSQPRRDFLFESAAAAAGAGAAAGAITAPLWTSAPAALAVGTLPETTKLPRVAVQGSVRVSSSAPLVDFLTKGLGFTVLRREQYSVNGKRAITTTVGYGPEQLAVPTDFAPGVTSFQGYGGHFTLQLVEVMDEKDDGVLRFYEPGTGLAYIQIGLPNYRISKLLEYGGEITSSYGFTEVVAPGGLPLRIILGNSVRDPFMFQALYTTNLAASENFYTREIGMKRCKYPRARPVEESSFEPPQPKGSVFLSYSEDSFGVLLLSRDKKDASKGPIRAGSVYGGLVIATDGAGGGVGGAGAAGDGAAGEAATLPRPLVDPDGFGVSFLPATSLGFQTGAALSDGKAVVPLRTAPPPDGMGQVEN